MIGGLAYIGLGVAMVIVLVRRGRQWRDEEYAAQTWWSEDRSFWGDPE